jgi:hypothetical protein
MIIMLYVSASFNHGATGRGGVDVTIVVFKRAIDAGVIRQKTFL